MAHVYTVTYFNQPDQRSGAVTYGATISETGAGSDSEVEIVGVPAIGTVVMFAATLTAGTAVTLTPTMGLATAFLKPGPNEIGTMVSDPPTGEVKTNSSLTWGGASGSLFLRNTPDAGSDNAISTTILWRASV